MTDATTSKNLIVLKALEGNDPTHLSGMQLYMQEHLTVFTTLWWAMFIITSAVVISRLVAFSTKNSRQ
jgi:hypothetical protein